MESRPDRSAEEAMPIVPLMIFFGSVALLLVVLLAAQSASRDGQAAAVEPTAVPETVVELTPDTPTEAAPPETDITWNLDPALVSAGDRLFHTVCMACHGFNGEGIVGLGKSLVGSEFINNLSDDELVEFMIAGRMVNDPLNTTGVPMPPRGGNPGLTDANMYEVVAYVRSLNVRAGYQPSGGTVSVASAVQPTASPRPATPSGSTPVPTEFVIPSLPDEVVVALAPTAISQPEGQSLFLVSGEATYLQACSGCHGADGGGVEFLASVPLAEGELVAARNGIALLEFLTRAEAPVDPREAFPHPYRGGTYPPLTDEQILDVIAHLYTLPR